MSRWESIIIVLLFALIAVYALDLHQVNEIRQYLERADNNPNISSEYAYIKDFMDSSTNFYVWYSTLLFAVVAIVSAFLLRLEFNSRVKLVEQSFLSLSNETSINNERHDLKFKEHNKMFLKLKSDNNYAVSNVLQIAGTLNMEENEYSKAFSCLTQSLCSLIEVDEDRNFDKCKYIDATIDSIKECINKCSLQSSLKAHVGLISSEGSFNVLSKCPHDSKANLTKLILEISNLETE